MMPGGGMSGGTSVSSSSSAKNGDFAAGGTGNVTFNNNKGTATNNMPIYAVVGALLVAMFLWVMKK